MMGMEEEKDVRPGSVDAYCAPWEKSVGVDVLYLEDV